MVTQHDLKDLQNISFLAATAVLLGCAMVFSLGHHGIAFLFTALMTVVVLYFDNKRSSIIIRSLNTSKKATDQLDKYEKCFSEMPRQCREKFLELYNAD